MKQVVMSEGKHDVEFVEQFLQQRSGDFLVDTFVGEDVEHSRLKNAESDCIRNFLERRNPYDVLVKSENGKPALKRVFVKLVNFLVDLDAAVCLLIDLDSRSLDALIDDLDTGVRTNYAGRDYAIEHLETVARNETQVAARGELLSDGRSRGEFEVLAFHSCLEAAAGIDDGDSTTEIEKKLSEFVEDSSTVEPTRAIFTE